MKKRFKTTWTKVQNFFRNSFNRLLMGIILLALAVPLRAGWVATYLGVWPSVIIGILWIIVTVFYFIMYLWALYVVKNTNAKA